MRRKSSCPYTLIIYRLAYLLHNYAHIYHGKQGTNAHDVPLPSTKEDEREDKRT